MANEAAVVRAERSTHDKVDVDETKNEGERNDDDELENDLTRDFELQLLNVENTFL